MIGRETKHEGNRGKGGRVEEGKGSGYGTKGAP